MLTNKIAQFPKVLWFLQLTYTSVILLANWFDVRLISIGGVITDAGTLIFPITFILSDLITEVYGYKHARRAIWAGFLFNFVFIIYGQLVVHLPYPQSASVIANKFDSLISFNSRIILASTISYLCSEPLNSYIMAKLKISSSGRYMSLRFVLSTVVASFVDSFIFGCLAFLWVLPFSELIIFNLTMWIIKVIIELAGLPLSLYLTIKLKQYEELDIYDVGTKFSIFKLDTEYNIKNNHFDI